MTDRIQAIKLLEFLNAANQRPQSDTIIYDISIRQKAIYDLHFVVVTSRRNEDIIKLLAKNIDEINKSKIRHKTTNLQDIQKIIFPKDTKVYFTEIYDVIKSRLISVNYLMFHDLLSFRNNRPYYICGKYENKSDHLIHARNLAKGWLNAAGID